MDFTAVSVGEEFTLFRDVVGKMKGIDGVICELLDDGHFTIVIYMNNMSKKEKEILSEKQIYARIIEEGNFLLPIIRYGNSPLIYEIEFNPFLYYQDKRFDYVGKSNLVFIFGIESTTNIIKTMRYVNMPKKLYSKMVANWNSIYDVEEYNKEYKKWVNSFKNYHLFDLWERATYIGKFGEK